MTRRTSSAFNDLCNFPSLNWTTFLFFPVFYAYLSRKVCRFPFLREIRNKVTVTVVSNVFLFKIRLIFHFHFTDQWRLMLTLSFQIFWWEINWVTCFFNHWLNFHESITNSHSNVLTSFLVSDTSYNDNAVIRL